MIGLLALTSSAFCFGEPKHTVVFAQDFEDSICGTIPKGLTDNWYLKNPTNEMCRYVTNIDAATGNKSLMCDFSQLSPSFGGIISQGMEHGWLSWKGIPSLTNGWVCFSIAVKRLLGSMRGEIRSDIGSRSDPAMKKPYWIAYWLSFGEELTVRSEAHGAQRVLIGALPKGKWCKIDLVLPLPCNAATNAWGSISVKGKNDEFEQGPQVAIPLGDMRLLKGYSLIQISGRGSTKWLVDDISLSHLE